MPGYPMSRLNPQANAFPASGGHISYPSTPTGPHSGATHTRAIPTTAPSATRGVHEIDLSHLRPTPSSTWARGQQVPSPTLPRYGHRWNSTFPSNCLKPAASQSNLNLLSPSSPTHAVRRTKSPSLPHLQSSPSSGVKDRNTDATSPTLPMSWVPGSPYKPAFVFEPFGDEDALLKEVTNPACHSTSPQAVSPTRSENLRSQFARSQIMRSQVATLGDNDVFRDDDDEVVGVSRNVFISNPSRSLTKGHLERLGKYFGRVVSVKVEHSGTVTHDMIEQFPSKADGDIGTRSYAFVMFDTNQAAQKFIHCLADQGIPAQFGNETPHLKQKALEDPHSSNCYFADIPLDFTEEEMKHLVYPGIISSLRFLVDSNNNRRGTAMVRMQSRPQAEEVINRLDLKVTLRGCTKPVQVRIADSENQKAYKQNANRSRNSSGSDSNRNYGNHSSPSSGTSQRSSSFSSNIDVQAATNLGVQVYQAQQDVIKLQLGQIDHRRLNRTREHGDIMDASLKYGTFESPGRTQALFPAPEDFAHRRSYMPMINHGHDFETYLWRNLCRSEDHTVTAPPPSLASSSASTSRSNSFDEACYSGLRQYHL